MARLYFLRLGLTHSAWLTGVALASQVGLAAAQAPAPSAGAPPAAASSPPQQTTATYEDWIVRCETHAGPPPQKLCEMVQFTQVKGGQGGVISQVAIGRPVKGQPVKLVIQLPIGVWLPTGIKLMAGAKDPGLLTTFKRCLPQACFTDAEINADMIRKLRTATEAGQIQFKDGNQKDVSLPVSFKGFATAYDALQKE
ncbi:MAG: invasion associated locus B family protein [Xanthobacteraceae bacterium]|nr:invasion associated locus B family protein [Xanthobacteraceae bacterium]